jgi:hypothetical protein
MCETPVRSAAWSRRRVPSTSTWRVLRRELEAQWIIVLTPSTASSSPSPVSRSPRIVLACQYLLITRTFSPASLSRLTTLLPSEPVPPVTRISCVFIANPLLSQCRF